MNTISPASMASPRFGEKLITRLSDQEKVAAVVGSASASLASSGSVGATTGSASGTAGTGLVSGGSGLMSTGPQSSVAGTVLNLLNYFGLGAVAAWLVAHPIVGGSSMAFTGSKLLPGAVAGAAILKTPK